MVKWVPPILLLMCCLVLAPHAGPVRASERSARLVDEGANLLERRRYEAALGNFVQAAREDPADAEAAFFAGAALNRLHKPAEAAEWLRKARELHDTNPELNFELGWALQQAGRNEEAIAALELFNKEHPGRGQAWEFLGRARLALGKYDEADAAFAKALELDPSLQKTVALYQALSQKRRGNEAAARETLLANYQGTGYIPTGHAARRFWRMRPRGSGGGG